MEKIIEKINSIFLTDLYLNVEDIQNIKKTELELAIGMQLEYVKTDNENNYITKATFLIKIDELDDNHIVKISHIIEFSSENFDMNKQSKEINLAIFEIIEPYIRFRLMDLLKPTMFSTFELPYRFWE